MVITEKKQFNVGKAGLLLQGKVKNSKEPGEGQN
jgi:hypothetical protein